MRKSKTEKNKAAQVEKFIANSAAPVKKLKYGEGESEFTINVYSVIGFKERAQMIREITDGVFLGSKDTIHSYTPEFLSLLKKYTVLKYFTDLTLPSKIEDLWLLVNYTSVYDDVINAIGANGVVEDIFSAADEAITAYKQYLVTKTDTNLLLSKISNSIKNVESKITGEDINKVVEAIKKMSQGGSLQDILINSLNSTKE